MKRKGESLLIVLAAILLFCIGPATAAINTIQQGNVVFIGEQGLDVSAAMGPDTKIGWWASAADIATTSPTQTVDLTGRITNFMVTPSEFSGYTGNWYRINSAGKADGAAFLVADPQLAVTYDDTTVDVDPALHWVPSGDDIRFKIDTNLAQIASQRSTPAPITIKVQSPDGAIYSSLLNAGGMPTSIEDIPVNTLPYYTGSIWNMGNPAIYPAGTYTIWAESNINHMKDNYEVIGKTVSKPTNLLNQGQNPLITKATTLPTQTTRIPTQIVTQVITSLPTQIPESTTLVSPPPTEIPTTIATQVVTQVPSPGTTKAPGFEATITGAALLFGVVFYLKRQ